MAGARRRDNLYLPTQDDVDRIARITLQENDLVRLKAMRPRRPRQIRELNVSQAAQQGNVAQLLHKHCP